MKKLNCFQTEQINKAKEENVDLESHVSSNTDWRIMDEVRLGLKDNIDLSKYVKMGMNYLQIQEIRFGILSKIDVSKYDKPNIGHKDVRVRQTNIPLTLAQQVTCIF